MSEMHLTGEDIASHRATARRSMKYRGLVGVGMGGAGLAAGFAGLPLTVSVAIWIIGMGAWAYLKPV